MLKRSRQREAILDFMKGRCDHPTADDVYLALRKSFPNISLGTVYRNLSLLAELGQIQKISCGNAADHFDPITAPHPHFVCKCCGHVEDLHDVSLDHLIQECSAHCSGKIQSVSLFFEGVCADCLREEEENKEQIYA